MSYTKTNWVDNTTPIDDDNLNKIEQGIYNNSLVADAVNATVKPTGDVSLTSTVTEGQILDVIKVDEIKLKGQTEQDGTPTPSAPIDVNVVSGSNVIKIYDNQTLGKELSLDLPVENLINPNNKLSAYVNGNNGEILSMGDATTYWAQVEPNKTYTFSRDLGDRLLISGSNTQPQIGNITTVIYDGGTSNEKNKTITNGDFTYLIIYVARYTSSAPSWVQLEKGSKVNGYTPYGTTPIELCKIGDNQDYIYKDNNKWYVQKKVNKINSYNGETISGDYVSTTGQLSTGATVYYVSLPATNTEIKYTTLINQLETIDNASLYEQTNITQTNNDLPIVLNIKAFKDNINGIRAWIRK